MKRLEKKTYYRWLIVNKCKGKKVLELGCINHSIRGIKAQRESGTFLFDFLHKYSDKVVGLDIDKKGVEYLRKENYDVRLGDAQNFNLGEKFDVIVACKLIDHLLNIGDFLESCSKHLKQKGVLIISDDNMLALPILVRWYFKRKMGEPDDDITIKVLPNYFYNFSDRYNLSVKEIQYFHNGHKEKLFSKFIPKIFIYPPLFYSWYMIILEKKQKIK